MPGRDGERTERAEFLSNQVSMAANFLELARKERELGRRSLLDILNGEIGLINAQAVQLLPGSTRPLPLIV